MILLYIILSLFLYAAIGFFGTGILFRLVQWGKRDSADWMMFTAAWPIVLLVFILAAPIFVVRKPLTSFVNWAHKVPSEKKPGITA